MENKNPTISKIKIDTDVYNIKDAELDNMFKILIKDTSNKIESNNDENLKKDSQ